MHLHVPRLIGGSAATCADLPQAQPGTAVPKVTYMGEGSPCHFGSLKCYIHPAADLLIWPTHLPSTNAPSTFFRCFACVAIKLRVLHNTAKIAGNLTIFTRIFPKFAQRHCTRSGHILRYFTYMRDVQLRRNEGIWALLCLPAHHG